MARPTPRGPATADELVAQVLDYAVLTLDGDGVVRSWNAGAERLTGFPAADVVGRPVATLHPESDRADDVPRRLLDEAARDGRARHEGWRVRRDGTRFWADVVLTALRDETGGLVGYGEVTRDMTAQHAMAEELRRSEQRFRVLVSQVVDYAIIALDPTGVITSWNAGAERVKGYAPVEALGRHFSMFYPAEDRASGLPERLLAEARRDGRVEHEGWRVRKDGSLFWGDVVITALHDEAGTLTGFGKVTRDLTSRKQLEAAQDSFYAAFEHDFRSPVAAIKGFSELLREDLPEDERLRLLERIEANADRLVAMTHELVEYARLRAGRLTLHRERLDLGALAREVVDGLGGAVDPALVAVTGACEPVHADRACVERVVANLVTNAVKYSPPGSRVSLALGRGAPGRSRLTVVDHGRGIAAEDLPHIFEEFERGRLAQEDGGTGLGLASVRQLVEANGGSVSISSDVGTGTAVAVDLPVSSTPDHG